WRGASSVFAVLARGLAEHGHTTTAVVAYQPIADGFRERNLAVRVLPVGHTTLHGARALRRGLLDLAADIVLVDRARDIRLAAFASLRTPLAVVYCISMPRPPRDLLTRLAFRRVALTVFLTQQLAQRALAEAPFMRHAGHRVIPNGVDCDLFRPDEAAAGVVRPRPDGVFALVLIEALACGRPVLAVDGGGTPELLGDAGVLAPPEEPRAFAQLLGELLRDPGRRAALAATARRRAVERYSVERMVRDYAGVLEALG